MRGFIAVLSGLVTAFVIVFAIESLGHVVYPPPAELNLNEPAEVFAYMQLAPVGALLFIALAHFLGVVFGNIIAILVGQRKRTPAVIFSVLFIVATGANFVMIPHPIWLMFVDLLGVILAIFLVFRLVKKTPSK